MMGVLKGLFSSKTVIDNVSSGIDKAIYTNEEKIDNFKVMLSLYAPFKIAQRLIAIIFCVPYAFAWVVTFVASFWFDVAVQQALLLGDISIIVGLIVAFYFGGGAVEGIIGSRKK